MKRIFFFITCFIIFVQAFILQAFADLEPAKVMSVHYDNSSALIYITTKDNQLMYSNNLPLKYSKLTNPNRIYFDINNAVLIGGKQQFIFEKSDIKEVKLAQFDTNPNIVRAVITFEEDFDTSKVKLLSLDGNIVVRTSNSALNNDYFNLIYSDKPTSQLYNNIVANSQFVQKVEIPVNNEIKAPENVMDDIQRAFGDSTLSNSDGKTYESLISVDISSNLKLRTKYYVNQYLAKNGVLLVSGFGQLTTAKSFYLKDPTRLVIDLPNTFLDKSVRNKEIALCPDGSCKDIAKLGQFERDIARIVISTDKPEKYLPIYSQDAQSLFLIDSDKLNHTSLVNNVANLNKAFVRRIDNKTNELILSFTAPIVHSILRTDNSLNLFLFNVQSYNEQDLIKTLANSYYKNFTMSLLPKIGVKAGLKISDSDVVKIEQSVDAKALKITISRGVIEEIRAQKTTKKGQNKNKIMLDAGHGGTDYGAIREGINEKDITLEITQRVDSILKSKGFKTVLVRNDDTFVSLEDRANLNEAEDPELFVSIHVNSAVSKDPSGIETHWYHDNSKELAQIIHKHMTKNIPNSLDRGLFKSKFYVINHTKAPAVLCEIGFLSNDAERNELITESRKQKTAKAIADGIMEYLKRYK